jgi:hypothetical protein
MEVERAVAHARLLEIPVHLGGDLGRSQLDLEGTRPERCLLHVQLAAQLELAGTAWCDAHTGQPIEDDGRMLRP